MAIIRDKSVHSVAKVGMLLLATLYLVKIYCIHVLVWGVCLKW